jgi:hypothetical protein
MVNLQNIYSIGGGKNMVEKKEKTGYLVRVKSVLKDKHGKVKGVFDSAEQKSDCMTNVGFAELAGLLLTDVGGTAFDYIAIGTGTTGAAATDTALQTEKKRKAGTGTRVTTTVANDTAKLTCQFSKAADGLTGTDAITEYGMLNAVSGGTLLLHEVDGTPKNCNWDDGDTLDVEITVQCKQGA